MPEVKKLGTGKVIDPNGEKQKEKKPSGNKVVIKRSDLLQLSEREVIYSEREVSLCVGDSAISEQMAKDFLGWETEDEYIARFKKENAQQAKAIAEGNAIDEEGQPIKAIGFADPDFIDLEGNKVRCWNNARNRPFKLKHCMALCQTILLKQYLFNFENIIIGRTGLVLSGQHRLIALIFACQKKRKEKHKWEEIWDDKDPTIETSIGFGVSEDQETVRTLDNTMPRDLADVYYTMDFFRELPNKQREEVTKYLATAVDFLWLRAGGGGVGKGKVYETHPMACDYLNRHPKLSEGVKHIFSLNSPIRNVNKDGAISAGQAAACLYLMAACDDNIDDYTHAEPAPSEAVLGLKHWKKACSYWRAWAKASKSEQPELWELVKAVGNLSPEDDSSESRLNEKMALLAKAWFAYLESGSVTKEDVTLHYLPEDENEKVYLEEVDRVTFKGIDLGPPRWGKKDENGVEDRKEKARKEKAEEVTKEMEEAVKKAKNGKNGNGKDAEESADEMNIPTPKPAVKKLAKGSFAEEVEKIKESYDGKLVLHRSGNVYRAWGQDANDCSKALKLDMKVQSGLAMVEFPADKLEQQMEKLQRAGFNVAVHDPQKVAKTKPKGTAPDPEAVAKKSRG